LAHQKNQAGTSVLVDYKNTSSSIAETISDDSNKQKGNGRIRIALAVVSALAVGTLFVNKVYSVANPAGALGIAQLTDNDGAQLASATGAQSSLDETILSEAEVQAPALEKPATEFVFHNNGSATSMLRSGTTDVPFVEVPEIDALIDPEDAGVAAFINRAPLTAANAELANDYTQEPSEILIQIKKGDSLSGVLAKQQLSPTEVAAITSLPLVKDHLVDLRPGDEFELSFDGSHRLTGIKRVIDIENTLLVERAADNQFKSRLDVQPLKKTIQVAELKLDSSLFVDGAAAGLSESTIMELYSIFQWTVDFNREVRPGDLVTVLFESFSKNGTKVKDGNILAAEYRASNTTHSAYRHVINGQRAYFDADGQSLKKRFLRNPIKARITSRFNPNRKHPIRHTISAHKGVDYGAPTGTAVSDAGDGRVVFMGVRGGYGNTVEIQHGDRYTTLYAHLSRFPKRLKKGARVSQGQIIGYVGSTGLATGPHLHYEFRVDGIHRDPQKVKLPGSAPLENQELMAFQQIIEPLRLHLASMKEDDDTLAMR